MSGCYRSTGLVLLLLGGNVAAIETLDEIIVTATRLDTTLADTAAAVSVVGEDDIQLGRQQLGLDEALTRVPGVFFQNRYNFTQDLRVAIRGFGSRANFGIRGIKVFADDIPATLADGQSGTDDVDMGSASRIEVIRGPSSSLYGTASGGVISLHTEDGPADPFVELRATLGEYEQQKYQLKTGGEYGDLNYFLNASHLTYDGYRDHSDVEHTLVNSKFRYTIDETSDITVIFNAVDSPEGEDSGGITLADVAADRRQAQARNLSSNSGETLDQQKFGVVYRKAFNDEHSITLRNYYLWRDFQTFLPIGTHIPFVGNDGVVEFDRFFFGGGAQYTYSGDLFGHENVFTTGIDIDIQEDDRQRFLNNAGVKGVLAFDQLEEAESYGFYFRNEFSVTDALIFSVGGRYDIIDMSVADRFLANGDQTGELDFDEFSPTVGLLWKATDSTSLYFNYATAFETPTFTELGSPAQDLNVNLGGFNNVTAQNADSFEIGIKGNLFNRISYDIAAFTMTVDDEVTNVTTIGNRAFFENADTDRDGFEAAAIIDVFDGMQLTMAYTLSDFEFDRFATNTAAEGNDLPGIPEHQFFAELAYTHDSGLYVIWDILYVSGFFAENANATEIEAWQVSNIRFGRDFELGQVTVSPYFGINNLFNEEYFSNVRLNAFGGRAFEPAPDQNAYGGVSVRYNW